MSLIARRDPPKRPHVVDRLFARAADVEKKVKNEELQPGYKRKGEVEYWLGEVEKMKIKKQDIEEKVSGGAPSSHNDLKEQVVKFTEKCKDLMQQTLPAELTLADCGLGDDDLEDMRRKAGGLIAREADVEEQMKNELQPGRKLKRQVEYWLGEVGKMKDKKQDIENKAKGGALSCPIDDLKKEVKQFTDKCTDLLQSNYLPVELTYPADGNRPLYTTPMKGRLFEENLEQVLSWLDGDGATSIGVYGMGGVGKTTLAKHVQNKLCQRFSNGKCSGYVYWVTVSHGVTLSSLQSKIAKQMGLENQLSGQDEEVSAAIIKEAFERRGNCVLILDDMWEPFQAEEIGMPIGEDGFKLLVTARSKDVCNEMDCEKSINVKCLPDDESWDLFKEKLGKSTILSEEVEDKARQVAKECKGLPIAIITIASSMRRVTSIEEWRNVLKKLQQLTTRQQKDMEKDVLPQLQFSYDRLGDPQLQDCFLCCAFYPEDYNFEVEELIACWTREGLLEGIESREERRDKGHSIVNRLVNACLLEYNDDKDGVKMHDLVREMAVKVCRGKHFLIRAGEGRTDILPEEEWTVDLCKVSLMVNNIESISPVEPPNCPNLKTLLLGGNRGLKSISSNFFSHLTSLRVLDLRVSGIESLPESISDLVNPTHLLLSECERLTDLPSLSKLQKLRELDLSATQIKSLPESISDLVNLTDLRLEDCGDLTELPSLAKLQKLTKLDLSRSGIKSLPESISDLVNLTELLLDDCNYLTDLPSLSKLQKLTKLDLRRSRIKSLPESISDLVNLTELMLFNCYNLTDLPSLSKLQKLRKLDLSATQIKSLPESISDLVNLIDLRLEDCEDLTELPSLAKLQKLTKLDLSETPIESLPESISDLVNLTDLQLEGCGDLTELPSLAKLQKLTKLDLSRTGIESLPESIFDLVNLTDLRLSNCKYLTYLPSLSKLQKLTKLDLRESGIKSLPESISDLVNLTALLLEGCVYLTHLPSLSKLQKLRELDLFECRQLNSWPDGMGSLRNLKVLDCIGSGVVVGFSAGSDLEELQLEHSEGGGGGKAKPLDLKMLEHLEDLSANWKSNTHFNAYVTSEPFLRLHRYCFIVGTEYPEEIMEEIREEIRFGIDKSVMFCGCRFEGEKPRIPFDVELLVFCECVIGEESSLRIREVPQSVEALKGIMISRCKGVEFVLCPASSAISGLLPVEMLRKLEILRLKELDGFKGLVKAGVLPPPDALSNLRELEIRCCNDLRWLLTPTMPGILQDLRDLRITGCEALEEVIGGSDNDVVDQPRYLPKLENLSLEKLPNLKSIRSGGLSNLRELGVKNCDGLKWLFTPTMACNMQNLSSLFISHCKALEELIGGSDNDVVDQPRYLPKLKDLRLKGLLNLKSIRSDGLSNLLVLEVSSCHGLTWLFTPTMAGNLQNLWELWISNCEALEEVIGGSDNDAVDQPRYLPKLTYLTLSKLPNLKRICPVGKNVGCGSINRETRRCPKLGR